MKRSELRHIIKEEIEKLFEFQQKYHNTVVTITGVSKGEAKNLFTKLTKDIEKDFPNYPKNIRIDF